DSWGVALSCRQEVERLMYTNINPATKKEFITVVNDRAGSDNPVRLVQCIIGDDPTL
ncbi:unnamed protein product, partial [marine sediment metagenome]